MPKMRWPATFFTLGSSLALVSSADPLNEVVVFGASYCQAGEPTPAGKAAPTNPSPYVGGRYSDGLVFGEYMKDATQATLYDYGVGGAHINPTLTQGGYYSSQEVDAYVEGIQNGTIKYKKDGLTVHIWWVGLNPIKEGVWANLTAQPSITDANLAYAHLQARQNAEAVLGQATTVAAALAPYPEVTPLMLLLPIPPTEQVPQTKYGDTNSTEQLNALGAVTETFNQGLYNGSSASGNDSSTFLYWAADNWWKDLSDLEWTERGPYNGTDLQLGNTDTACLVLKSGQQCAPCRDQDETDVCDSPDTHLYWDALHPTTVVQQDLSVQLLQFLNATNATSTEPSSVEPEQGSEDDDDEADDSSAVDTASAITFLPLWLGLGLLLGSATLL